MTYEAVKNIVANLNEFLADADADYRKRYVEQVISSIERLREWSSSEDGFRAHRINASKFYEKCFNIMGGKTRYNLYTERSLADVEAVASKQVDSIIAKRNQRIAEKLNKAEVTEVLAKEFVRTSDGFNGVFKVNTNKGNKTVTIDTIYAGGYNIQVLHTRTLVKVR